MTQMNLFSKQKHTHWHRDQWWLPEGWGGEGQTENLGILHLGGIPDGSNSKEFSTVQSLSRVRLFATPWTAAHQASLSITNSRSPLKPMSIELVMPCNHLILCQPLLLLPSIFPSISLFKWLSSWHQVAKVLEFQFQHQSFQWTPRTHLL